MVEVLDGLPPRVRDAVGGLTEEQLDTPYRPGGWTVRQVVHHLPDSHMNAYLRFKLAVTEDTPAIKTYEEAVWAETEESRTAPVESSLDLLEGLHTRWALFLRTLQEEDFQKAYRHPKLGKVTLEKTLQLYVWHGKHHLGHVKLVAEG